jgi:hypothetical protein
MNVVLANQTSQLMIVILNSGASVHLAPKSSSGMVPYAEINSNQKIQRLVERGHLAVKQQMPPSSKTDTGTTKSKSKPGA